MLPVVLMIEVCRPSTCTCTCVFFCWSFHSLSCTITCIPILAWHEGMITGTGNAYTGQRLVFTNNSGHLHVCVLLRPEEA